MRDEKLALSGMDVRRKCAKNSIIVSCVRERERDRKARGRGTAACLWEACGSGR